MPIVCISVFFMLYTYTILFILSLAVAYFVLYKKLLAF
ncbi:Hypothetical protein BN2458_PEG1687 [Helicobacter typhlonius]|uniref:Uncharacterized protein n=1 Tax=Helicobacter typhlonius TaxID=76936 RepID=A0A0S4PXD8_9HELI|nr:Hypothetical protein BN2458_PEG1687 [Helicobacter typhlonius]